MSTDRRKQAQRITRGKTETIRRWAAPVRAQHGRDGPHRLNPQHIAKSAAQPACASRPAQKAAKPGTPVLRPLRRLQRGPHFSAGYGTPIHQRDEMVSLTDMWRAAGSPREKRPSFWLAYLSTKEFVGHIQATLNAGESGITESRRGRGGGTWAHWQIAMAYAKFPR